MAEERGQYRRVTKEFSILLSRRAYRISYLGALQHFPSRLAATPKMNPILFTWKLNSDYDWWLGMI